MRVILGEQRFSSTHAPRAWLGGTATMKMSTGYLNAVCSLMWFPGGEGDRCQVSSKKPSILVMDKYSLFNSTAAWGCLTQFCHHSVFQFPVSGQITCSKTKPKWWESRCRIGSVSSWCWCLGRGKVLRRKEGIAGKAQGNKNSNRKRSKGAVEDSA